MRDIKELEVSAMRWPSDLGGEDLELFLQEADRALMLVESRNDEPGRRVADGGTPDALPNGSTYALLSLAVAELADAYPEVGFEIERVSDRIRTSGARSAAAELAKHRHLMDMVRLSLEALFTVCTDPATYAGWRPICDDDGDLHSPVEMYNAYQQLLQTLRNSLN